MSTETNSESGYKSASFVFDSYAYVRRLRDAGMDEQQAAIQAETFMAMAEDRLATKRDIVTLQHDMAEIKAELKRDIAAIDAKVEATKAELKKEIETAKTELKRDIAVIESKIESSKADTIKWTAGMFAAQTALILGAMFAIMRMNQPPPVVYQPPAQEMRLPAPTPASPSGR
ncbi:DUF1640 domain-containing protein [Candidatus Magnetaquicoccus inordinatus]|uniref:DUF1640 domain-containing protein n=1 Tax=Candidatus Magnetaquicoccus inordinatus TaxID=2496818 RepID=UPI00187D4769|nr:DUF1640 domain-containing protein [Candidatus Magnetaquicoccus inordinatus]